MQQPLPSQKLNGKIKFFTEPGFANVRAVVCIGNPGSQFNLTRHNIGFMVYDAVLNAFAEFIFDEKSDSLADQFSLKVQPKGQDQPRTIEFFKPKTFVNKTGEICRKLTKSGLKAENFLIVHDELEKPVGYAGTKFGGSHKGHNGLKSVIDVLGPNFWRLFVGIDRPEHGTDVGNYVLSRFRPDEKGKIDQAIGLCAEFFSL